MKLNRGFTLVEMMVTLVIMAIIASMALPSFRNMILQNRVDSIAENLKADLELAKAAAAHRGLGVQVGVVASTCGGSLDGGWDVRVSQEALADCGYEPSTSDEPTALILKREALKQVEFCGSTCASATDPIPDKVRFSRGGLVDYPNGLVLVLKPVDCPSGLEVARQIAINGSGVSVVSRVACP